MENVKIKSGRKKILFFALLLFLGSNIYSQNKSSTEMSSAQSMSDPDLNWMPAPDFFPNCSFTVLHGDLDKPNLDFFFKIEPNTEVVNHTHNSQERMVLLSGDLEVQYEGETAKILKEGTYAYGPANKPHRAKCLDNGPCVLFVAMVAPFDAVPVKK